jgi:hypothetical protein
MDKNTQEAYQSIPNKKPDSLKSFYYSVKMKKLSTEKQKNATFYKPKSSVKVSKALHQNSSLPEAAYN